MEITQQSREDRLELQLKGRFDANWADHVGKAIESAIRAGQHHIDLDLGQVNYISSAGIRILVKYFKQLNSVRGALRVVRTTDAVLSTLQLSGFATRLVAAAPSSRGREEAEAGGGAPSPRPQVGGYQAQRWERHGVAFESRELGGDALE